MSTDGGKQGAESGIARCPICRKPVIKERRPFCSKRCAEIDLGRWLKGGYAFPGSPAEEAGEALQDAPYDWEAK